MMGTCSWWNMGFATFKMVAVSMVNGMTASPAVIRNQQCTVQSKTDESFKTPVGMKCVVATFVS